MEYIDDFEQDSGMESSPLYGNSSKDDTPERKPDDLPKDKGDAPGIDTVTPKPPASEEDTTEKIKVIEEKPVKSMEQAVSRRDEENYDDEPDETLGERLWGLTEMFPDSVTNATSAIVSTTVSSVKTIYSFSRTAAWIAATSSIILFAPVLFELERAKMDEMQKSQQKQFLLGPNAAMQLGPGAPPPISR